MPLLKVTDYSSSSEESESSDDDGETVGHDGTVAVSDIPRIMYVVFLGFFPPSLMDVSVFICVRLCAYLWKM